MRETEKNSSPLKGLFTSYYPIKLQLNSVNFKTMEFSNEGEGEFFFF